MTEIDLNLKSLCIFGDSLTWGAGVTTTSSWGSMLRDYIDSLTPGTYKQTYNLGVDGDDTVKLLKRIDVEADSRKPIWIILAVGVNDSMFRQPSNVPDISPEDYANNLRLLIKKSKEKAQLVWVVGPCLGDDKLTKPLPRSITGKSYSRELVSVYSQTAKEVSDEESVSFIETFNLMSEDDFTDGVHLGVSGHSKLFAAIVDKIKKDDLKLA